MQKAMLINRGPDEWTTAMRNIKDHGAILIGFDGQIPANRDILIARSEVFALMFEGNWAEKSGVVNLPYSIEAIRRFYYFVKTGKIDKTPCDCWNEIEELAGQYLFDELAKCATQEILEGARIFSRAYAIIDQSYDEKKNI